MASAFHLRAKDHNSDGIHRLGSARKVITRYTKKSNIFIKFKCCKCMSRNAPLVAGSSATMILTMHFFFFFLHE